jgi:hypothetical protein
MKSVMLDMFKKRIIDYIFHKLRSLIYCLLNKKIITIDNLNIRFCNSLGLVLVEYKKYPTDFLNITIIDDFDISAKMPLPVVVDLMEKGEVNVTAGKGYFFRTHDAIATQGSDIIGIQDKAYWAKSRSIIFDRVLPTDKNLKFQANSVLMIRKPIIQETIECGFMLLGATESAWGHFLVQYYPRLKYLKDIELLHDKVELLVPEMIDPHIEEMINMFISKSNVILKKIQQKKSIKCKILYVCDSTSYLTDHCESLVNGDTVVPDESLYFLNEQIANMRIDDETQNRKIYLRRGNNRGILNSNIIDSELERRGYEIVYPHTLSFSEKIKVFGTAQILVGPLSSGFANLIFCKPGTTVLALMNTARAIDPFFARLADGFHINLLTIIGKDEVSGGIHTSFKINIERFLNIMDRIESGNINIKYEKEL